jgi:hypothetical protein
LIRCHKCWLLSTGGCRNQAQQGQSGQRQPRIHKNLVGISFFSSQQQSNRNLQLRDFLLEDISHILQLNHVHSTMHLDPSWQKEYHWRLQSSTSSHRTRRHHVWQDLLGRTVRLPSISSHSRARECQRRSHLHYNPSNESFSKSLAMPMQLMRRY